MQNQRLTTIVTFLALACTGTIARCQTPIIFDTDITGDVDDVLALAMLHTLSDNKECELRAVTISKIHPLTGRMVDAVNTFYGRPNIPIGVTRDAQVRDSKYLAMVDTRDEGKLRYPHDVTGNDELPDATQVLRRTLASSEDHSVVMVQVGLAANLADLVESKADDISDLSGRELIQQKVREVQVMAGAFQTIDGKTHFLEANVRNGIQSMQRFADQWPNDVPVIWSGFEIGIALPYPRQSIARDFAYTPHHIVREAYLLYCGPNHDRPSWDLTSVLDAVRPDGNFFGRSQPGRVSVEDDGFVRFTPNEEGRDRYLTMTADQQKHVLKTLQTLVSQPPRQN
ncbi:Inosine-uridine preferring nucleoside hydrolase [Rubripirellula lacrimiformis]|uniref:Inosine-uridine preferring nucleoside hydrolase n=1 Tax=Rubripirellula lacrimiformis TaxID=1930273 RepID=A0A517N531_9BACT|nr:nucleoside hydrolase [Rubripirellula lacrimiformis]QDT02246.1 Inosine-uridine preferring nucleoside hydrolase [Rubripirellula lacrimiformis]